MLQEDLQEGRSQLLQLVHQVTGIIQTGQLRTSLWVDWAVYSCLPDKLDGVVTRGEDGLAGSEEAGLSSVAFIHHEDHVEQPVEDPLQRLDPRRNELRVSACLLGLLGPATINLVLLPSGLRVSASRAAAGRRKPSQERSSARRRLCGETQPSWSSFNLTELQPDRNSPRRGERQLSDDGLQVKHLGEDLRREQKQVTGEPL